MHREGADTKFHPTFLGLRDLERRHGSNLAPVVRKDWTCRLRGKLFEALLPLENKKYYPLWRWDEAQDSIFRSQERIFVCKAGGWTEIHLNALLACAHLPGKLELATLRHNPAELSGIRWSLVRKGWPGLSSVWCLPYATFHAQSRWWMPGSESSDGEDDEGPYALTAIRHKFMLFGRSTRCPGAFERLGLITLFELDEETEGDTASFLATVPLRDISIV